VGDGLLKILPKKGDKSDPANYRGIMLLEVAYKIVANIVHMRLQVILESQVWRRSPQSRVFFFLDSGVTFGVLRPAPSRGGQLYSPSRLRVNSRSRISSCGAARSGCGYSR